MKGIVVSEVWSAEVTTGKKLHGYSVSSPLLASEVSAIWQDPPWNGAIDRR